MKFQSKLKTMLKVKESRKKTVLSFPGRDVKLADLTSEEIAQFVKNYPAFSHMFEEVEGVEAAAEVLETEDEGAGAGAGAGAGDADETEDEGSKDGADKPKRVRPSRAKK